MIKLSNITKAYDDKNVFSNFNMEIEENKITCILGPSGIGKTTLINIISGLTTYDSGKMYLPDNCEFSYVFQEPRLLEWLSVSQNIELVLKKVYDKSIRENIIYKYVSMVGLQQYLNSKVANLSGGMTQRVAIARAFAYPSNILIMDEPFHGLDVNLEEDLIKKFKDLWNEDRRTVICVTHNIEQAIRISDRIIILNNQPVGIVKEYVNDQIDYRISEEIKKFI